MIMDDTLEFADAVSVAAAAGTANIGDIIDMSLARDVGNGQPVYLVITTDTAVITGGTAGTVQFRLVSDATSTISTTTATVHWTSRTFVTDDIALAELLVGTVVAVVALPLEGLTPYEQFLGVQAITATTTTTAGAINAFLTLDPHGNKSYPDAVN